MSRSMSLPWMGKTKNTYSRVMLGETPLYFEVKEFAAKEIKAGEGALSGPTNQSMQRLKVRSSDWRH